MRVVADLSHAHHLSLNLSLRPRIAKGQGVVAHIDLPLPETCPDSSSSFEACPIQDPTHRLTLGTLQVLVVGGGAGGVELSFSLHHYLQQPREGDSEMPLQKLEAHVT